MAEKATIFQNTLVGIQSGAGTPATAFKKLLSMSFLPGPANEAEAFRAMGNKYASFVIQNKEWSKVGIEGRLTYNEILYALASLLGQPTPTQQGATSAYKWVFSSSTSAPDDGKLLTVDQGDATSAWRAADVLISGLSFNFSRNEVSVSGSGFGVALETGITLDGSPTSMTPRPVLPSHLKFYKADTRTDLDTAQALTRSFSMAFNLTDKSSLAWPVGVNPVNVEKEPGFDTKLKLATDTVGMGMIATMRNGDTGWFRIKGEGATIASTYKYTFQIDWPAQILEVGDPSDQENIYAIEYTLKPIHDATWGKAFEISVIADVQTL